jgi:small subunit ribosomal protein S16
VALKIRLARGGARRRPFYRMVVADSRSPRDGAFLEKVGSYDPLLSSECPNRVVAKEDRIKYWLSVGAKLSETVTLLLSRIGLCERPVVRDTPIKSALGKKALERQKVRQQKESSST